MRGINDVDDEHVTRSFPVEIAIGARTCDRIIGFQDSYFIFLASSIRQKRLVVTEINPRDMNPSPFSLRIYDSWDGLWKEPGLPSPIGR